jgi:predicted GNAT superfamily acetyltransferase
MATSETAGERAKVSAPAAEIRNCHRLDEFRACLEMQKEVWGFTDAELVPLRMFVVAAKVGGQVIGAFQGSELVGFALAVPGARAGHPYLHSHMLAVRQSHRNSGLGRKIKLFQREDALGRGFELIEWTFDPLEIKNAYLNIERLAAIARRYNLNQYGITSSPLQGFLPTDRLVAEWWLRSKRVETFLASGRKPEFEAMCHISVPAQIYEWKAAEATRTKAAEVQTRNREQFLQAFGKGLSVLGYERDAQGDGTFLLGRWEEKWSYGSASA